MHNVNCLNRKFYMRHTHISIYKPRHYKQTTNWSNIKGMYS